MGNVQALLLAAGKDKHPWTSQAPRQLSKIAGEPLILRTLRQLEERGLKAWVVTHKEALQKVVPRYFIPPKHRFGVETFLSTESLWMDKTIVLPSDVIFSDNLLDRILADQDPMSVYGGQHELFAVLFVREVIDQVVRALNVAIADCEAGGQGWWWGFYRALYGSDLHQRTARDKGIFKWVRDYTNDLDSMKKYHWFLERYAWARKEQ